MHVFATPHTSTHGFCSGVMESLYSFIYVASFCIDTYKCSCALAKTKGIFKVGAERQNSGKQNIAILLNNKD